MEEGQENRLTGSKKRDCGFHLVPNRTTPMHVSHFFHLISAYEMCQERFEWIYQLIREGIKKAEKTHESQIVDDDCMEHILICHPAGTISLYREIGCYKIMESKEV